MSIVNDRAPYRAEAARLRAIFEAQGAVPVEPAILQPAEIMLDLYGEQIIPAFRCLQYHIVSRPWMAGYL